MTKTILVNKENKLKETYLKRVELINIKDNNLLTIEKETYENFINLKKYLEDLGIIIDINNAYKDIDSCTYLDQTTGLGIEININNLDLINLVHENLYKFGFILRYPKDKENSTFYKYNPLYIRYVGKIVAKIIYENNYSLEEYLNNYSGILIINKPKGITSFDVVFEVSKLLGIKKIGHTGTLDPLASGVLILTIGKATKIGELLTSTYKEYVADVLLGISTDTLDITGNVINKCVVYDNLDIEKVLSSFKKKYMQEVPIYSAVKVNGKKLYQYARNNEKVILPKKEVDIKEIELLNKTNNTFKFRTLVSKGCYIRSLIRDIGTSLNTYCTMTDLIRIKQYKYKIEDSYTIDDVRCGNFKLISIKDSLDYKKIVVDDELEFRIRNGQRLINIYNILDKVMFINKDNYLLGIYEVDGNYLKVWKNFN